MLTLCLLLLKELNYKIILAHMQVTHLMDLNQLWSKHKLKLLTLMAVSLIKLSPRSFILLLTQPAILPLSVISNYVSNFLTVVNYVLQILIADGVKFQANVIQEVIKNQLVLYHVPMAGSLINNHAQNQHMENFQI